MSYGLSLSDGTMNVMRAIFVINLEYRKDRRIAMEKQLSRIGWHAEFISAVRPTDAGRFPSIGARGCFLSHLSVLRKAQDAATQQLIILEDDVNFTQEFGERWRSSISELEKQEWSIFYPGHLIDGLPVGLSRISPSISVKGTHFMVINGRAISTLVDGLEKILTRPYGHPLGSPIHVDGAYTVIRRHDHSLVTYAQFPVLGYQRPSRTDIGDLKWFDRVGILTPIASLARKLKTMSKAGISKIKQYHD